ncbi:hypothetical protein B0I35DRAFT_279389 [Stachybotrys elegans]|uniref:Secreted protein n=1 Tax=Stachybotrys elegans TaxID=80388 RepID=A0A8K0WPI5_9HYPO|nr:hypothetical protein B0I35DRAFT_279389 [Stachybotrys elegans]
MHAIFACALCVCVSVCRGEKEGCREGCVVYPERGEGGRCIAYIDMPVVSCCSAAVPFAHSSFLPTFLLTGTAAQPLLQYSTQSILFAIDASILSQLCSLPPPMLPVLADPLRSVRAPAPAVAAPARALASYRIDRLRRRPGRAIPRRRLVLEDDDVLLGAQGACRLVCVEQLYRFEEL